MTVRQSTGLRNALCGNDGFSKIFINGEIRIYSGTQPASADAAATGTLLGVVTAMAKSRALEARASATLTLAGTSGSVLAVKVGGMVVSALAVDFTTDLATTAALVAASVSRLGICYATSSGAVVTVYAPQGTGVGGNGVTLDSATDTLTATSSGAMAGGASGEFGLRMAYPPANGVVSKLASEYWQFVGLADGSAGWFRLVGGANDSGMASTTLARLDGSIGSTGDMVLASTMVNIDGISTIDAFTYTIPAA